MDQEKFGNLIKTIRKNNNLTQKEFADKYGVTYQAVSKWERGLNMPDTALIKQMSKDFNISIEELLEGKYTTSKKKTHNLIIGLSVIIIIFVIVFLVMFKPFKSNNDFQFKTLSSSCDAFTISGSIAYNASKTAISITNIKYCGGNDEQEYKMIECTLYESHDNILKKISTYKTEQERIAEATFNGVYFSVKPVVGNITSRYGVVETSVRNHAHGGLDIAAPYGTSIKAAADGTVSYSGWMSGYGYLIIIDHANGVQTYYGHCSKLYASVGDEVSAGDVIAAVGSTGNSTGNHLHLEIRLNGEKINPQLYLYK